MLNRFTAHRTKPFTIFLLAIGLMGLVGLAALLLNLEFISPKGSLFQVPSFDNIPTEELNVIETGPSTRTAFFVWVIILVLVLMTLVAAIRHPKKYLSFLLVSILAVYLFNNLMESLDFSQLSNATNGGAGMPFLPPPGEAIQSVDLDQPVPGWFRTAFQLSLTIPVLLALYLIYRRYRPSPISNTQSELRAIGLDAQAALIDLESGVDFKNAILNCYAKMVASLNRQHGIRLETSVTAREFERQLQASGLPLRAIQRLTRLFEMVRYGSQEYSERDRHEAIDCLNEVITAIQAREQSESQQQTQRLPIQPEASR